MALLRRITNLFCRSRVEREIDAELKAHLALRCEDNIGRGMTEPEARREALVRFGNPVLMKERSMDADVALGLAGVGRDVHYALRQLRRAPGIALTAIVTLALGIGANIVVFGVLNAVVLHPLNVAEPGNLYQIFHKEWMSGGPSYPAFEEFQQRNATFSGMAAVYGLSSVGLRWQNAVRKVWGYDVTGNYFDLLGVEPEVGRFFHASDEHGTGSAPYVVLSDRLWRSRFGANPGVIGAAVELNRHPFTVIGVARPEFQGTERFLWPDYWVPMVNEVQTEGWDFLHDRVVEPVAVIGRLKPGVTAVQATADLNRVAGELAKEYPATDKDQSARLIRPGLMGDDSDYVRRFLFGVMTLAVLVLLAGCANLASLFAARAADREREIALRVALGSSRSRLLRQLLTEAVLVSLLGGAAGTVCAGALLRLLNHWAPFADGAEHLAVALDWMVYAAALGLSLASGLLFGLIPAQRAWKTSPLQSMKSGPVGHLRRFAARDLLLGAQIAICTLLVTASLVAVRSMERLLRTPLGIEPQGATLAEMDLGMMGIAGDDALVKQKQMIAAVMNIPGVTAAGTVNFAPLSGAGMRGIPIYRPGTVDMSLSNLVLGSRVYPVSPEYFQAAGTRLLTGRNLTWNDDAHRPRVAVVNETFARKMFGTNPAIGQHFVMWGDKYENYEVVGIAEDGKYGDLTESQEAAVYTSSAAMEGSTTVLVVRSRLAENEIAGALQRTLHGIEPGLPIKIRSWQDALSNVLFPARTAAAALSVMGLLAAMLAVTGIFGMAAYSVSKRMKELGLRVALGARRVQLMRSAVGRPVALLAVGSALGMMCGMLVTRLMSQLVYEANPRDPLVLVGVMATMALLGGIATCIPARRALRVNPSVLMREE